MRQCEKGKVKGLLTVLCVCFWQHFKTVGAISLSITLQTRLAALEVAGMF